MKSRGTKNVGIRLSGNVPITCVVISPAKTPNGLADARMPRVTAITRSSIPNRFHATKIFFGKLVLDEMAEAMSGAVAPIAMSPHPAGRAKTVVFLILHYQDLL